MRHRAKKSLGQNFLIDKNIQNKIIDACNLGPLDSVLEIGSGRGELTTWLCEKAKKVYAIEIDKNLYRILKENLAKYDNIELINADILKFDFKKFFKDKSEKIKIVGNIPYYISSPIIQKLSLHTEFIHSIYLTLQKEFARRLIASCGTKDFGSFSCFAQYYFSTKKLFQINKSSFFPQPKVDSVFLRLNILEKRGLSKKEEREFFKLLKLAFNKRRKMLKNCLKDKVSENKLNIFFKNYKIDPCVRPEMLNPEDFKNLARIAVSDK